MRTWLLIAIAAAACSKSGKGASNKDGVLVAWKKGGLEPSELKDTKSSVGKDCAAGTVNKLDVLVCTFASDKEAKAAEDGGLEWIGDNTGVSGAGRAVDRGRRSQEGRPDGQADESGDRPAGKVTDLLVHVHAPLTSTCTAERI